MPYLDRNTLDSPRKLAIVLRCARIPRKTMNLHGALLAVLASFFVCQSSASSEGVKELPVQHAFGSAPWQDRGSLLMSSDGTRKTVSLKFSQVTYEFNDVEREAFDGLLSSDGYYRVRVQTDPDRPWTTTSIPACLLAASNYNEVFRFHFDKSGALATIDYTPMGQASACTPESFAGRPVKLKSRAKASLPSDAYAPGAWGPKQAVPLQGAPGSPETAAAQGASSQGQSSQSGAGSGRGEAGEEGAEQEQSFLRKYWYILLPIGLMSLFGPAPPQDGQNPAAGGAGGAKKKK